MRKKLFALMAAGALGAGMIAGGAPAKAGTAYVVTRPGPGIQGGTTEAEVYEGVPVQPGIEEGDAQLVVRRVYEPAATVSRALAEQPVYPYLVEVKTGLTRVYLDPAHDYQHTSVGGLDENNTLLRALRLAEARKPNPPYLVVRPGIKGGPGQSEITPSAVIPLPTGDSPYPLPEQLMPSVPRQTAPPGAQMARADE